MHTLVTKTDTNLKYKAGKKFQANGPRKQTEAAILLSNKSDLQIKVMKKDGKWHLVLITHTAEPI